jgi:hypothetical protein
MTMTMDGGVNTYVSQPGGGSLGGVPSASAAPGAQGPGAQVPMAGAVAATILVPAALLVGMRLIFGSKDRLPPLRVDATNVINVYFSWLVANGAVKLIAYRYHGHKLAQAYLVIA